MSSVNKVILLGRLGADPESRDVGANTVCSFSLATNWKGGDGEKKERTEWHRCQAWGRTGEVIQQYCRKGGQVCVEGRLQTRSWEDRDGNKRYTTEVVVLQVYLIGGGGQQQDRAPVPCDDEIPF